LSKKINEKVLGNKVWNWFVLAIGTAISLLKSLLAINRQGIEGIIQIIADGYFGLFGIISRMKYI